MSDYISRQAVDELSKELVHTTRDKADFLCNFWEGLQKLPSVENKGEPTDEEVIRYCNKCGYVICTQAFLIDYLKREQSRIRFEGYVGVDGKGE